MTKERKKRITLIILVVILVAVLIYNYGGLWPNLGTTTSTGAVTGPGQVVGKGRATGAAKQLSDQGRTQDSGEQGYRPLALYALDGKGSAAAEPKRNIFVYYTPPPAEIEVRKGPPPTISLSSLSPDSVYARTGDFTLRVKGAPFPEDAKILLNGQEQETKSVSPSELSTTVSKMLITAQGSLAVEVRTARGDFSNQLALNIMEAPTPAYKYVGKIGDMVFLASGDDRYPVRIGDLVDEKKANRWRVVAASDGNVTIQDVMIGVNHRLDMDLGQAAATTPARLTPAERNRIRARMPQQQLDENEDQEAFQQEQEEMQNQQLLQQQMMQQQMLQQQMMQQQMLQQQLLQQRRQQQRQQQIGQPGASPQQVRPRPYDERNP